MAISLSPPYNAGMVDNSVRAATFAAAVVRWQKKCGRNSLPWQNVAAPYETWISEVMLQQTQAATVIPYYQKFVRKWRDVAALARARPDSVMAAWSGLGYYARARNLHAAAQIFRRNGFPQTAEEWRTIPGIGKSTAAAIAVFAYQERAAILDGNVKRVLARVFAVQTPIDTPAGERELWTIAESLLPPRRDIRRYTQGMMDLGAAVCIRTKPKCGECPLAAFCRARADGTTADFPRRKPRKTKPEKFATMALIVCGEFVFLQKRPPHGIWGGMWSLPENESAAALKKECAARMRKKLTARGADSFTHEFTHFRLNAKVLRLECAAAHDTEFGKWRARRALGNVALPSPVRKCIRRLAAG